MSPSRLVGSYPAFSPFPDKEFRETSVGNFCGFQIGMVVFFSVTIPSQVSFFRKYGALCCPDFPSFPGNVPGKNDRTVYCLFILCKWTNVAPKPYSLKEASWNTSSGYLSFSSLRICNFSVPCPTPCIMTSQRILERVSNIVAVCCHRFSLRDSTSRV